MKQKIGTISKIGHLKEAEIEIFSYQNYKGKKIFIGCMKAVKEYEDGQVENTVKKLFDKLRKEFEWVMK